MTNRSAIRRLCAACLLVLALRSGWTRAQQPPSPATPATTPATRPTTGRAASAEYELHEWAVFVQDAARPELNAVGLFPSALPDFAARGGRAAAPAAAVATQPSPVGVIRLVGNRPADGDKIDVLLEVKAGRFHAHWPPSKSRAARLLWDGLELLDQPAAGTEGVPPAHWYAGLRGGPSAHLQRGRTGERFLLYDAELAGQPNPVRLTLATPATPATTATTATAAATPAGGSDAAYLAANTGSAPVHDVQVYKPADGGWRLAGLPKLDPGKPSGAPSGGPATGLAPLTTAPATTASGPAAKAAATASSSRPTTAPATTSPTTAPVGVPVPFSLERAGTAAVALEPWKAKLAAAGLPGTDVPVILATLEHHALDPRRTTVVYRLDSSEMDRLLPLEVSPAPRKIVRVGLVVLRNAGPELADEVDRLIALLGDEAWPKREEAQKQLAQLGPAAQAKLQAAMTHKDQEIAWRAERLVRLLSPPPPPKN